jgi:hypothetical protein
VVVAVDAVAPEAELLAVAAVLDAAEQREAQRLVVEPLVAELPVVDAVARAVEAQLQVVELRLVERRVDVAVAAVVVAPRRRQRPRANWVKEST